MELLLALPGRFLPVRAETTRFLSHLKPKLKFRQHVFSSSEGTSSSLGGSEETEEVSAVQISWLSICQDREGEGWTSHVRSSGVNIYSFIDTDLLF